MEARMLRDEAVFGRRRTPAPVDPQRPVRYLVLCARIICVAIGLARPLHLHAATSSSTAHSKPPASPVPADARQLILVTAEEWTSTVGSLSRYARDSPSSDWRQIGTPTPVTLGRSGLGWGKGLQPDGIQGPSKIEGDGKSPAGVFTVGKLFGYEPPPRQGFRVAYIRLLESTQCIEDARSRHYNQIVDASAIQLHDWSAAEHMRRTDDLYRLGVFVNANTEPVTAGRGSCIFIHVWRDGQSPTAGCTAMDLSRLRNLAQWLDATKNPVLVQLPMAEYRKFKRPWRLS
jgi:L,D-peptidoglycan transpeptidase YkuD (ErfK/YbiS/YcfS/YnhG family)